MTFITPDPLPPLCFPPVRRKAPDQGKDLVRRLLFLLLVSLLLADMPVCAAPPRKTQVLVLHSYHQGFRWTDDITAAVVDTMTAGLQGVEFHIEYMDSKRVDSDQLTDTFRRLLALKYRQQQPDIIITSDDSAFTFMRELHRDLFPAVPVVFCGVNDVGSTRTVPREFFTGIIEYLDIKENIEMAHALFPQIRQVVVVTDGSTTGLGTRQEVIEAQSFFPETRFVYLNGEKLTTKEMLNQLRTLGDDSVVLAPAWYTDRQGKVFDNTEIYPLLAKASPVPVIAMSSANLGLGVFGGKVNSGATQGKFAAEAALRILSGAERPIDIPVQTIDCNQYQFDSRQLARFGIEEKALPPGSVVLYRPFSFYRTYKYLVWSVSGLFLLFIGLIAALLVNIHRLREARFSLAGSEENLRITLHSIGDAVITTDIHGRVTRMNPAAETLTGLSLAETAGRPLAEVLQFIDGDTREPRLNPVDAVLQDGAIVTLEKNTILLAHNGGEYRIADSVAPIRDSRDEIQGVVFVFHDITAEFDRDRQEIQRRKLEAIGQLAGGVAHDFNNMLGGIIGSAEMLALQLGKESPQQKYIATILKASENASGLIRKLLAFSRTEALVIAPMDVHQAIISALGLLEHSLDKNITIKRSLRASASVIDGDAALIENAIINLCVNAAQAMPKGGVLTLATENVELDFAYCRASPFSLEPGTYVRIAVQDTGTGIAPELLDRIYEPFFTTKGAGKGTGLGLPAVYGTAREHRGCLWVVSEVGAGTVFYLALPVSGKASGLPLEKAEDT